VHAPIKERYADALERSVRGQEEARIEGVIQIGMGGKALERSQLLGLPCKRKSNQRKVGARASH